MWRGDYATGFLGNDKYCFAISMGAVDIIAMANCTVRKNVRFCRLTIILAGILKILYH